MMMSNKILAALLVVSITISVGYSQIDTSYIYNPTTSFGPLDIRIARDKQTYYFLEYGKTFTYREVDGVKTNAYLDMTAWDSSPYEQGSMQLSVNGSNRFVMNYRLLKPTSYDDTYDKGYPLVLVLHGLKERGNCAPGNCYHGNQEYRPDVNSPPAPTDADSKLLNNDYNLIHGGSNYLEASTINGSKLPDDPAISPEAYPGFVLFPQNLNGWDVESAEDAIRLVRLIAKEYNVDMNRIYINGISNGGHGAYEVMNRAPWLFAAGVLFSAADDASLIDQNLQSRIANIPLWIFQGGQDTHPTPRQTERYVKVFRDGGANVKYSLYPQLAHGTWNKAFSEPDFFTWMLSHKRNSLHVKGVNPVICATTGSGAVLSMPEGYAQYEWQSNGITLSGEMKSNYVAKEAGTYRGRFKAGEWNDWSEIVNVTVKELHPAKITQYGTVHLKDPNQLNEAHLEAETNYPYYYWYKDGKLIDFPGKEDDTLKVAKLKSANGNGIYTLQVADFDKCPSPPSLPKHVYFNDKSPININSPSNLILTSISPSSIRVSWQDASGNESGFEIWRRRIDTTDTLWTMAGITESNIQSFNDLDLTPASVFEYMVRAVSESGRSKYTSKSTAKTSVDNDPPSAPTDLTASITGVKKLKLGWNASVDDSAIKEYIIVSAADSVYTRSNDTTFILNDFTINTSYTFHVYSVDLGGNISEASNSGDIYTNIEGLFYEHSTGDWTSLNEIDWTIAEFEGVVENFTLKPKTQEDFFNFRFDGYLNIVKDGVYQFRTSSNDGSRLSIGDTLTVENDGIHNLATVTAPIQILASGPHRITVDFFDSILADTLIVEYKGPDSNNEWTAIPSESLRSDLITSVEDPSNAEGFDFSVFPNPSSTGVFNIVFTRMTGPVSINLLTHMGQKLHSVVVNGEDINQRIVLPDLPLISTGFYIIDVSQNNTRKTKKLIVNR